MIHGQNLWQKYGEIGKVLKVKVRHVPRFDVDGLCSEKCQIVATARVFPTGKRAQATINLKHT